MSSTAAAGKASRSFLAEPTQWSDFSFFTGKDLIVASIYRLRYMPQRENMARGITMPRAAGCAGGSRETIERLNDMDLREDSRLMLKETSAGWQAKAA